MWNEVARSFAEKSLVSLRIFRSASFGAMTLLSQATWAVAQSSTKPISDGRRIERLADLGRLWGFVKFAHPALAYQDIDWDQALVRVLPAIRVARSAEDYAAAINDMLSALNDPQTRAAVALPPGTSAGQGRGPRPPTSPAPSVRTIDGTIVIDVAALAWLELAGNAADTKAADSKLTADIAMAKGVVFDLRLPWDDDGMLVFVANQTLRSLIGRLLNRSIVLGASRSRQHYGYPAQNGLQSGGYSARLVTDAPGIIMGRSNAALPLPIVLLADAPVASAFAEVLAGLKAAGLARVVEETGNENTRLLANVKLVDGVQVHVATSEIVRPDGQVGVTPDLRVQRDATLDRALDAAMGLVQSPPASTVGATPPPFALQPVRDKSYAEMALPDVDHRLLALFRLWSVTRYFFPYTDLMDRAWFDALVEFLPRFEAADTALAYQTVVMEMAARLQDTHVRVSNATAVEEQLGLFAPPLLVSQVDGQAVVRYVHDPDAVKDIRVGDVILAVDGVAMADRRKLLEPLVAASTPQAMSLILDRMQLRGPKDSTARLQVGDGAGIKRDVTIVRTRPYASDAWLPAFRKTPQTYGVLPSGFGYIDLERLPYAEADAALDAVMGAPAVIFDMRGYPHGTAWTIAPRLMKAAPMRPVVGALFRPPLRDAATLPFEPNDPFAGQFTFEQTLSDTTKSRYQGKVVMLIDASAISQAEHTCLLFAAATDVTFIGSPTNGANGDITNMVLPGNLFVSFTGQEVRFADGRQLQRVGVLPNIVVQPTIPGIRAGRDEVFEAAIEYLRNRRP
jgi:C-terminal processing protease CtpA/Prc